MTRRPAEGRVVVVTGASSGIGRATARVLAYRGAILVLSGRRAEALAQTANDCRRLGAEVVTVVADIGEPEDVERLVERALALRGRIDIWINNAGTTLFGRLHEGDFEAHRQVIETNLIGPMYAARLVMPLFKRQRHGVLVNVGSVLSEVGQAFVPSYAISKFGLRGLSEALRSDVADEPDIHVCSVLPYAVDTPHFETGANVVGRRAYAMQPVQRPERVAGVIADVALCPRRVRYVPRYIPLGLAVHWMLPRVTERLLRHALERFHLAGQSPRSRGNLEVSSGDGPVHGSRRPLVGRVAFARWVVCDLARMTVQRLRGVACHARA